MAQAKVKWVSQAQQIQAADDAWLTLGELRELVRQADAHGWADGSLVSHSAGREHPSLRHTQIATRIIVEGPS